MARSILRWSAAAMLVTALGVMVLMVSGCGDMPCHKAMAGASGCGMHGSGHAPSDAAAKSAESPAETVQAVPGKPVNSHCPIMGGKINPDAVKSDLTRTFNGQTVAFCCGGCPAQWDKLTDQARQDKLAGRLGATAG